MSGLQSREQGRVGASGVEPAMCPVMPEVHEPKRSPLDPLGQVDDRYLERVSSSGAGVWCDVADVSSPCHVRHSARCWP